MYCMLSAGAANKQDSSGGIYQFFGTSQFYCMQAISTTLSRDKVDTDLEGTTWSFRTALQNSAHTGLKESFQGRSFRFARVCVGGALMYVSFALRR